MSGPDCLPDWEKLLAAERQLQRIVPGSVLVGGTAAALHAKHRQSIDGDHVVSDLRSRFDQVLADLESVAGWQTNRIQRPVPILCSNDERAAGRGCYQFPTLRVVAGIVASVDPSSSSACAPAKQPAAEREVLC